MNPIVPRLIITGLAASVSPVAVTALISVLARKHARRNSLVFLLGYTLTLTALGIVGVFVFHIGGSGGTSKIDGYIDLALGILCLLAIPFSIKKQPKQKVQKAEGDLKALSSFSLGGIAMIVNMSTLIVYFSGLHVISSARLGPFDDVLALALLTFFSLISLIIPIIIYFVFPKRSERVLNSLRVWLSKHSKVIGIVVLAIFGIYLVVQGARVIF